VFSLQVPERVCVTFFAYNRTALRSRLAQAIRMVEARDGVLAGNRLTLIGDARRRRTVEVAAILAGQSRGSASIALGARPLTLAVEPHPKAGRSVPNVVDGTHGLNRDAVVITWRLRGLLFDVASRI